MGVSSQGKYTEHSMLVQFQSKTETMNKYKQQMSGQVCLFVCVYIHLFLFFFFVIREHFHCRVPSITCLLTRMLKRTILHIYAGQQASKMVGNVLGIYI